MTGINPDAVARYASHYMAVVAREHGTLGEQALETVIETVREVYKWVEPDSCKGPVVVFKTVPEDRQLLPPDNAQTIVDLSTLPQDVRNSFALQPLANSQFLLWKNIDLDVLKISEEAVVYEYRNGTERFLARRESRRVLKLVPSASSMFSMPTFSELGQALEWYRTRMVRQSFCPILSHVWFDKKRLFFISGPERFMRDSLTLFLKSSLRGNAEVRPEQNVDETHPIDIKITWMFCNRLALIEIKWLGKSKDDEGRIRTAYWQGRAHHGAKQLAEYLDMNLKQVPDHITRGYLVVIDGRRYRMNEQTQSINQKCALYYRDRDLTFDPKYHETRDDFTDPVRMFAEPAWQ